MDSKLTFLRKAFEYSFSGILHFDFKEIMKSVPLFSSVFTSIVPPSAVTISLQIVSPRPTPARLSFYVSLSLPKHLNSLDTFSSFIPTPVSLTIRLKPIWMVTRSLSSESSLSIYMASDYLESLSS